MQMMESYTSDALEHLKQEGAKYSGPTEVLAHVSCLVQSPPLPLYACCIVKYVIQDSFACVMVSRKFDSSIRRGVRKVKCGIIKMRKQAYVVDTSAFYTATE